ncbi:MAG: outer membrane beta-barrel protein [Chitinophagaceae bacterium]|nr:outer membrane beta-barrel protein [Chitinophagaceae bacterium]
MKNTFLLLLLSVFVTTASAQSVRRSTARPASKSGFSVGLEAGIPVGENAKPYGSVLGASLQYEVKPDPEIGVTFNGGYLSYNLKSSYGEGSVGFVPLLAGVKYYPSPEVFFHAQLGAAVGTKSGQGTSFAYAPGIGYKFSPTVDVELKYLGISNSAGSINNVGVRLGFNF